MKPIRRFECPKCGNKTCHIDTISTTGRFLSRIFNFHPKQFTTVTCSRCSYTE